MTVENPYRTPLEVREPCDGGESAQKLQCAPFAFFGIAMFLPGIVWLIKGFNLTRKADAALFGIAVLGSIGSLVVAGSYRSQLTLLRAVGAGILWIAVAAVVLLYILL